MEKYSSWRRGAPAKGVGRETGARVRVSPSAPSKKDIRKGILFALFKNVGRETRTPSAKPIIPVRKHSEGARNTTAACGGCRECELA